MESVDRVRTEVLEGLDAVVCEEFRISPQTAMKGQSGSLVAIEIIGAVRWICHKRGVPFITQRPSDAKAFASDAKLKQIGWYTKGVDHSRDATRHLLLYLIKQKVIDPARCLELEPLGRS